jgi:hypothetical protein
MVQYMLIRSLKCLKACRLPRYPRRDKSQRVEDGTLEGLECEVEYARAVCASATKLSTLHPVFSVLRPSNIPVPFDHQLLT